MPLYEYKCRDCGVVEQSTYRGNALAFPCDSCGQLSLKRVFGFALKPMMHEHYNQTVGKPISDMRQFKSELRRASDEAEQQTGIPHNFQPVEYGDKDALGVTGDGIDESNSVRSKQGMPLLPELD